MQRIFQGPAATSRRPDALRLVRRGAALSLAELARKTGFSVAKISRLERGLVRPRVEELDALFAACAQARLDLEKTIKEVSAGA